MAIADFTQTGLIDIEQFEMLVEAGDSEAKEMLTELLDLFTGESGDNVKELVEKVASGENERATRLAHAIAGSAGNLGLLRLSVVSRDLENQFNDYSLEERKEIAQMISDLYEKSTQEYQAKIDAI
jgi:HPt (histidine-containing phosphotransfer) domain-containing protein